jgi:hypothetical protein
MHPCMQCIVCSRMLWSNHFSFYFQILSLKFVELPVATRGVSPSINVSPCHCTVTPIHQNWCMVVQFCMIMILEVVLQHLLQFTLLISTNRNTDIESNETSIKLWLFSMAIITDNDNLALVILPSSNHFLYLILVVVLFFCLLSMLFRYHSVVIYWIPISLKLYI